MPGYLYVPKKEWDAYMAANAGTEIPIPVRERPYPGSSKDLANAGKLYKVTSHRSDVTTFPAWPWVMESASKASCITIVKKATMERASYLSPVETLETIAHNLNSSRKAFYPGGLHRGAGGSNIYMTTALSSITKFRHLLDEDHSADKLLVAMGNLGEWIENSVSRKGWSSPIFIAAVIPLLIEHIDAPVEWIVSLLGGLDPAWSAEDEAALRR